MVMGRANFASLGKTNKRSAWAGVKRSQRNPDPPADVMPGRPLREWWRLQESQVGGWVIHASL